MHKKLIFKFLQKKESKKEPSDKANTKHRSYSDRPPGKRPLEDDSKNKTDRPFKKKFPDQQEKSDRTDRKIPDRRER